MLLSYECFQPKFNQAKAIVGMPRIIQLCDGIMAGGQPAQTHGIYLHQSHSLTTTSSFLKPFVFRYMCINHIKQQQQQQQQQQQGLVEL